jgi:hypothetical protein
MAAVARKASVLNGPGSVYMLDAVSKRLLPSHEALLQNCCQDLVGISDAIAVQQ